MLSSVYTLSLRLSPPLRFKKEERRDGWNFGSAKIFGALHPHRQYGKVDVMNAKWPSTRPLS
jgi:hypothetical protein